MPGSTRCGHSPVYLCKEVDEIKLSITQIALGLLILAIVLTCPAYLLIVVVPGVTVLGVGIVQLVKARR